MKTFWSPGEGSKLVLAVDDEEDHLLAFELAFGRERDLSLISATNTREAELTLAVHHVDAVLLDLSIPEDGGIAFCRRIKAQRRFRRLPVIALSALPAELFSEKALAAGCSAFLQKPCSLRRIVAEVRRHLGGGSADDTRGELVALKEPAVARERSVRER